MITENNLTVPEGYFEESYGKTMRMAARSRRRFKTVVALLSAFVLLAGSAATWTRTRMNREYEAYMAQQKALAELDVFLEIN